MWPPPRRSLRLDVLIPSSFSRDTPHPRDRTMRLGMLARALAAARVDTLVIYHEDPGRPEEANARLIKMVMDYLNTAPYLRRRLYPLARELRYAGILPPLNIPTHPESLEVGGEHWREGLVVSGGEVSVIEAGMGRPIKVGRRLVEGSRILVHVKPGKRRPRITVRSRRKAPIYPGFKTTIVGEPLREITRGYGLSIATSRKGRDIREAMEELREMAGKAGRICVAFGAARQGLAEILQQQGASLEEAFHMALNTMPMQGVRTIRTEEAVYYTLAILNLVLR